MSESIPNSRQESADASTPLPPIDNIHSAAVDPDPELPAPQARPEPALPSDYGPIPTLTPAQTQLDTDMPEAPPPVTSQTPNITPSTTTAPRTATPTRHVNGTAPETAAPMPSKAASHGAPARRYLNEKVTGVLLDGMKRLAADQPENPLQVLGEFLLQRSREIEGTS